ncbi:thermonuclease family protein [Candidatus Woesebacteria bacterium]|nr:thermonuclease family protein [Candidatus Woesebacteria bacterium]
MKTLTPLHYRRVANKFSLPTLIFVLVALILGGDKLRTFQSDTLPITPTPMDVSSRIVTSSEATNSATARVVKVVDGDTISVLLNGKKETVRLIGIDTPEVVDPRRLVQCFGKEASEKTKQLLTDKQVTLVDDQSQGNRDKYNRLLRYVFLDDVNINQQLLEEGYAHEYTYRLPYTYQPEFTDAERRARENKKGLWADGVCPVGTVTPSSL